MVGTSVRYHVDENEADKFNKVKKFGALSSTVATENTKRAALGDLQNRGVLRAVGAKDVAQKDIDAAKMQNALRGAKARVDTHWKKAPMGTASSANAIAQQTQAINLCNMANAAAAAIGATAAGQRKVLTRSNSVRVGAHGVISTAGLQRHGSANLIVGTNKPKTTTLITKVVDKKTVHQVKFITKGKPTVIAVPSGTVPAEDKIKTDAVASAAATTTLRREDSSLSRKSLTKLKAALSAKPAVASRTAAAAATSASAVATAAKKDSAEAAEQKSNALTQSITLAKPSDLKIVSVQSHSTKLLDAVENIDADDADKLLLVSEYVNDIYNYLYSLEVEWNIRPHHLDYQEEVSPKMRAVLVDWINEVHFQFHLAPETFQMSVAIIDRYLQEVPDTKKSHLQLVGVTALFIAAKYEELYPPAIADFVYITDDTYNTKQILQMELRIFRALDCNLARPLPIHFLRRYSKAAKAEDAHHAMSKYFLELASIEYDLASYKPSEIAAASLFLSLHLLKEDAQQPTGFNDDLWTPTLEWYSRYSSEHLRPITKKIAAVARNAGTAKLKAVHSKYQSTKLLKISLRSELYGRLMDSIISSAD